MTINQNTENQAQDQPPISEPQALNSLLHPDGAAQVTVSWPPILGLGSAQSTLAGTDQAMNSGQFQQQIWPATWNPVTQNYGPSGPSPPQVPWMNTGAPPSGPTQYLWQTPQPMWAMGTQCATATSSSADNSITYHAEPDAADTLATTGYPHTGAAYCSVSQLQLIHCQHQLYQPSRTTKPDLSVPTRYHISIPPI